MGSFPPLQTLSCVLLQEHKRGFNYIFGRAEISWWLQAAEAPCCPPLFISSSQFSPRTEDEQRERERE